MRLPLAFLAALAFAGLYVTGAPAADEDAAPDDKDGVEVLTRGPVHEAYAEAIATRGKPGVIVSKKPPRAIDEAPPEEKPKGDNVVWIPGYWSWDEDGKDFVWVSGFWRAVPPGRTWVPGSWQKGEDGWQWVSGYWGKEDEDEEPEYLPKPPESIERGPSRPAPDDDCTYVPGCWVYRDDCYVWRPGYWIPFRPGWVWVPSCYHWAPCGYLFVPGYWDVPLCDRGLLFAPVRVSPTIYLRRTVVYKPAYVIEPDFLVCSLFVRSGSCCYYFGDYFAPRYRKVYIPWVEYRIDRIVYDCNYSYYRCAYSDYPTWDRNLRLLYAARYEGDVPAPPRTLVQQNRALDNLIANRTSNVAVLDNLRFTNAQNVTVVQPLVRLRNVRVTGLAQLARVQPAAAPVSNTIRLENVGKSQLAQERRYAERLRILAAQRRLTETRLANNTPASKLSAPVQARLALPANTPPARVVKTPKPPPPAIRLRVDNKAKPKPVPSRTETTTNVTPPRPVAQAPRVQAPAPRPVHVAPPRTQPTTQPRRETAPAVATRPHYDYTPKPAPASPPAPRYVAQTRPTPPPAPRQDYARPPQPVYPPNYPANVYAPRPAPQPTWGRYDNRQPANKAANGKDKDKDKDKKKKKKKQAGNERPSGFDNSRPPQ
jgi:hypothetical protein